MTTTTDITYTDPDVLTIGVEQGWADPETDPKNIDWELRRDLAWIPFKVVDGRPVNPYGPTGVRYGRNQLGHWGEAQAADAVVTADTADGHHRWLLMVRRSDGHGWALPGGMVEPGEGACDAARRELAEETGLALPGIGIWEIRAPRYVEDPRASDEAWIVTTPCELHLGSFEQLPAVFGDDDAIDAAWIAADDYYELLTDLETQFGGTVFAAHRRLLQDLLNARSWHGLDLQPGEILPPARLGQLREQAAAYRQLRAILVAGMDDWITFAEGDLTGEPTLDQLIRYITHLATASRGDCDLCQRPIQAPDTATELSRLPWRHPRRWRLAGRAWRQTLTGRTRRIAHTRCAQAHRHWGLSRRLLSSHQATVAPR